ncbi:MAG: DEAD/DEAH box helicase, partial [Propionibacteriaceae bacterium]
MSESLVDQVLAAAVEDLGGTMREGQLTMAHSIDHSLESGEHLLVQAGTGTGKSLGYLAPALVHLTQNPNSRVVVATATLALQA